MLIALRVLFAIILVAFSAFVARAEGPGNDAGEYRLFSPPELVGDPDEDDDGIVISDVYRPADWLLQERGRLMQLGDENSFIAVQGQTHRAARFDVLQQGDANASILLQEGAGNDALLAQIGNQNVSVVAQLGGDNFLAQTQSGHGLGIVVTQFGGASVAISQTGN